MAGDKERIELLQQWAGCPLANDSRRTVLFLKTSLVHQIVAVQPVISQHCEVKHIHIAVAVNIAG